MEDCSISYGDERALEIAKEIGADAVDFHLPSNPGPESIYAKSDDEIIEYYTKIRKKAESIGLEVAQTHGRLEGFKNIPEEDEKLIKDARIDCLITKTLGAPVCVMHGVTTIFLGPDADPQLMHDLNFTMFNRIISFAKQYGIYNLELALGFFGKGFEIETAEFGIKLFKHMLKTRYGEE